MGSLQSGLHSSPLFTPRVSDAGFFLLPSGVLPSSVEDPLAPTIGRTEIVRGCWIVQGNIREVENAGLFLWGQIRDFGFSLVWHELEFLFPHGSDEWRIIRAAGEGKGQKPLSENVSPVPVPARSLASPAVR
jgi:hypothetical protein